jgi:hypothetical protein
MYITIKETKEVKKEIDYISVEYFSRYEEDAPAYAEDVSVEFTIAPDGQILKCDPECSLDDIHIYTKVTDSGSYYIYFTDGTALSIEQDYVPSWIPGQYGDYIDFKIKDGIITNWSRYFTQENITEFYESQNNNDY